jgi:hypothetical protein
MFDGYIVVYKFIDDLHFFVTGGEEENELILASVLQGFTDAVGILLRFGNSFLLCFVALYVAGLFSLALLIEESIFFCSRSKVDKRTALENLDLIFLCIDEVVDGG